MNAQYDDVAFFNPANHTKLRAPTARYAHCSCSWTGVNFDMHIVGMTTAFEALNVFIIEEE